ncbi:MAG: DNRLRE domain-containing protein [Ferruginibacter sp.]
MKKMFMSAAFLIAAIAFFPGCTKTTTNPSALPPVASAGPSQIIQLPVSTTTVTGSGTSTNGIITGYLWSLVSGPNVPVINSPSSPTTAINGLIAGTYILQFAVIDEAGLTGIDTLSIKVNPSLTQTLTLQPSNNPGDGHTDSYNNIGGSGDTKIMMGEWTVSGTPIYFRSFLKFDLSGLPPTANIQSATLYLYAMPNPHGGDMLNAHSGAANASWVERIPAAWTFTGMTWANQPASTATNRVAIPQSVSSFDDNVMNVTALVKDMQTSGNYGFKFTMQNETVYNFRQYASSFHSNASLHPKLVITYQ